MRRMGRTFCCVCAVTLGATAQEQYALQSELRTSYTSGSPVSFYSRYQYDSDGNRVSRLVHDGADSLAGLLSRVAYSYNSQQQCTQELLTDVSGDTLSIVRYTHGLNGLTGARTLSSTNSLLYRDSLFYTGPVVTSVYRHDETGATTYFRRYSYVAGALSADTLFEPDGSGGFTPTQARVMVRNADGTVASEHQWRSGQGIWYAISTTIMGYTDKKLVSATRYETDGLSRRLMDSLAYPTTRSGTALLRPATIPTEPRRTTLHTHGLRFVQSTLRGRMDTPAQGFAPATLMAGFFLAHQ